MTNGKDTEKLGQQSGIVEQPIIEPFDPEINYEELLQIILRFGEIDQEYTQALQNYTIPSTVDTEEDTITAQGEESGRRIIIKKQMLLDPLKEIAVRITNREALATVVRREKEEMSKLFKVRGIRLNATDLPTPYEVIFGENPEQLTTVRRQLLVDISLRDNGDATLTFLPNFDFAGLDQKEIAKLQRESQRPPLRRSKTQRRILGALGHALDQYDFPSNKPFWIVAINPVLIAAGNQGRIQR